MLLLLAGQLLLLAHTSFAACSATYEINTACQDCDKSKLKSLPTSDKCTIGCEDGYVLITNSANWISSALPAIQATFTTEWKALRFDGSKTVQLGNVGQSAGPPLFANCRPYTTTRCSYSINTACADCDKSQLISLPTADKCTIGCNDGFRLITNSNNWISSAIPAVEASFTKEWQALRFDGSKTGQLGSVSQSAGPPLFANCRPFTPATPLSQCAYEINTACPDCDKSQLRNMRTSDKCTIGCAEGYVLITNSANWISSAQPALQASFAKQWDALRFDGSKSVIGASLFANCRPFTNTPPTPTPTTPTPTTPTPTTPTPTTTPRPAQTTTLAPKPTALPPCGCPYFADVSNPAYDSSKLFVMDTDIGRCTLQCDAGYRLRVNKTDWQGPFYGAMTSVSCTKGSIWHYRDVDVSYSILLENSPARFSCEAAPATCSRPYGTAPCRGGKECNDAAITNIKGKKSDCILSCSKGYQLVVYSAGFPNPYSIKQEVYFDAKAGIWIGVPLGEATSTSYMAAALTVTCERWYDPAATATPPPIASQEMCGCPYERDISCAGCDATKLWVVDNGTKECTITCERGWMLNDPAATYVECTDGKTFYGKGRASDGTLAMRPTPTLSCIKGASKVLAPGAFKTFECNGCDSSKIMVVPSSKSEGTIMCDRGYRLVANRGGDTILRLAEANLGGAQWSMTYLNAMATSTSASTAVASFNCEPIPGPAKISLPECGCAYAHLDGAGYDGSQLTAAHDGAGSCQLGCKREYELVSDAVTGSFSLAMCALHRWTVGRSGIIAAEEPKFSCKKTMAAPACSASFELLTDCPDCDATQLKKLSTPDKCTIGCDRGFRLITNSANLISSSTPAVEASFAKQWEAIRFDGSKSVIGALLYANCRPFTATKPLPQCGCSYTGYECYGCDSSKVRIRSVWKEGGRCELTCARGYKMIAGTSSKDNVALLVCENSEWFGKSYDFGSTIALGKSPGVTCVKAEPSESECKIPFMPLENAGYTTEVLQSVPSGVECALTCKPGWRIVGSVAGSEIYPRIIHNRQESWGGPSGANLLVSLPLPRNLPRISCKPDTWPVPSEATSNPGPKPSAPCEYCKQPKKVTSCPPGKKCDPTYYPLWLVNGACMQTRCALQRDMLVYANSQWMTTKAINCQKDGKWAINGTNYPLTEPIHLTCDANTTGEKTIQELLLDMARKGVTLKAFD